MHDFGPDRSRRVIKGIPWSNSRGVDQRIDFWQESESFGKCVSIGEITPDGVNLLSKTGQFGQASFIAALCNDRVVVGQIRYDGAANATRRASDNNHLPVRDRQRFQMVCNLEQLLGGIHSGAP